MSNTPHHKSEKTSMNLIEELIITSKVENAIYDYEEKFKRILSTQDITRYLLENKIPTDDINKAISSIDLDFFIKYKEFSERIVLTDSAIPAEIPIHIKKQNYKLKGEIWTVHKNDADPFPSSPHAHNYQQNIVMHLGNGSLYRKRDHLGFANRKVFLHLRSLIKNVCLPQLENVD